GVVDLQKPRARAADRPQANELRIPRQTENVFRDRQFPVVPRRCDRPHPAGLSHAFDSRLSRTRVRQRLLVRLAGGAQAGRHPTYPHPPAKLSVALIMTTARSGFRDLWALRPGVTYLNHGSFGPSPRAVT